MERKRREGNKDFKKGGQAGSRGGCLKGAGTGTPLRTMYSVWKTEYSAFLHQSLSHKNLEKVPLTDIPEE